MAKGENIFKRKDGRWEARYVKGYDLSGKIRYGFCYGKTYREAKEKVTKCKADIANGRVVPGRQSRRSFGEYCDEWLANSRVRLKDSTYVKYHTIVNHHIRPKLGDCCPQGMSTELIRRFSDGLLQDGLSPKTVKDILMVLRSILNDTEKQLTGQMPHIEIVYPKASRQEMRVLTVEEQARFTSYLLVDMDECKLGVLLALMTGLRIGELCALQWKSVSAEQKTLRVSATMLRLQDVESGGTKIVVSPPKTDAAVRTIPLTEFAAQLCAQLEPSCPEAYVLTGSRDFMEPRTLQYRLARYTKDCGLEGVHFHTLRHTFATRCVEVGFELKSLSEILGHSTTTITLERYVHSSMELKRSNMEKLSAIGF